MNRKNIIIAILSIIILTVAGIFYLVNQTSRIEPVDFSPTASNNDYIAELVKSAVENYENQDRSESSDSRTERLSLYFSGDSPVYKRDQDNISSSVNKSSAKVISISPAESEGGYVNLKVTTDTTFYSNDKTITEIHTYWVSLVEIYDGTLIPYDITGRSAS